MLDPAFREVRRGREKVELTAKEFALLEFLMRNAGQTLTRDQIMTNVWDDEFDSFSNVVDVHVANLRKKLDRGRARTVETVRGVGYRIARDRAGAACCSGSVHDGAGGPGRPAPRRVLARLPAARRAVRAIVLVLLVAAGVLIDVTVTADSAQRHRPQGAQRGQGEAARR